MITWPVPPVKHSTPRVPRSVRAAGPGPRAVRLAVFFASVALPPPAVCALVIRSRGAQGCAALAECNLSRSNEQADMPAVPAQVPNGEKEKKEKKMKTKLFLSHVMRMGCLLLYRAKSESTFFSPRAPWPTYHQTTQR